MKIGLYSPYLDTFGGGERYILTIAECCLVRDYQIDLLYDQHLWSLGPKILKKELTRRLDIDLSKVHDIKAPLGRGSNFFKRLFFLKNYDLLIYLTDGSIFYSTAKNSILHFQVPFKNKSAQTLWGKLKLSSWQKVLYNSKFTRGHVEMEWPIKGVVLYPPVDVENFKPLKKGKYILSVGRFFGYLKSKKHDIMIDAFRKLYDSKKINGWSLHLAGSAGEGDKSYLRKLRTQASGLPIFFYPNISFKRLKTLYGKSYIYWHAAGFGETDPSKMEHFGISTVEAMAAGAVPVVIASGGQKEIVIHGESGFLWETTDQLKDYSLLLINNQKLLQKMAQGARERSKLFSKENFCQKLEGVINGNC